MFFNNGIICLFFRMVSKIYKIYSKYISKDIVVSRVFDDVLNNKVVLLVFIKVEKIKWGDIFFIRVRKDDSF